MAAGPTVPAHWQHDDPKIAQAAAEERARIAAAATARREPKTVEAA
jgi:hypothetical protein